MNEKRTGYTNPNNLARRSGAMLLVLTGLLGISQPTSAADGQIVNISTRALVGTGDEIMLGSFIIEDGAQEVLVQALGPELANPPTSLSNAMADPVLTLIRISDGMELMHNDNWEDSQEDLVRGIWGDHINLNDGSASSALVTTLDPGRYTAKVEGKDGSTGVALVEVYGIDSSGGTGNADGRIVNISTRALVGTGDEVMLGSFIIQDGAQEVLVQALGPELANPPTSLSNAMADPVLTLIRLSDGMELMRNDDWEDSQEDLVRGIWGDHINLSDGSSSSALVTTLDPGRYTAKVEGKDGTTGVALVEVYGIETDTQPGFADESGPGDQSFTVDTAISALTLPEASGGNGTLTYSLAPNVSGLSFDPATRRLTGTPTTAGSHSMTYTVTDADGDSVSLTFTVTIQAALDGVSRTVRLIYLLPSDRPYRQEVVDAMKVTIRHAQTFFAEQMQMHGHGNVTFRYETDGTGEPLVHRVNLQHPESYYAEGGPVDADLPAEGILFAVQDISGANVYGGRNSKSRGSAFYSAEQILDNRSLIVGEYHWYVVVHELGHAFGLEHDWRDGAYIMSYGGGPTGWERLSACAADFLSIHPFFNAEVQTEETSLPTIDLVSSPAYPTGATSVSVQLQISDPDGLHQVLLLSQGGLKACQQMNGEQGAIVEFDYDGYISAATDPNGIGTSLSNPLVHTIEVMAIDAAGDVGELTFELFDVSTQRILIAILEGHSTDIPEGYVRSVTSLSFSPEGTLLASAAADNTIRLWNVAARKSVATLPSGGVESVAFSPDGSILASGGVDDGFVRLWDVTAQREIGTLEGHTEPFEGAAPSVIAVAFSPDGSTLASGGADGTVKLWDVTARKEVDDLEAHPEGVYGVTFSPEGSILASGGETVKLWDFATRKEVANFPQGTAPVAFSPEGKTFAHREGFNEIKLRDAETWNELTTLEGHTSNVSSLSFSPNGAVLASGSYDATIRLWDVAAHEEVTSLGGSGEVFTVAFSPDGAILATGSDDGTIRLWDMSPYNTGTEPSIQPGFAVGSGPGDQSYPVGTAITSLTLPAASGGNGALTYSLTPSVPGLSFDPTTRRLTGMPTTAGTYSLTYTVTDADGNTDSLTFTITVQDADDSGSGGSFDLHKDHFNSRGIAYANDRFYIFRWLDNKVYAYTTSGQRDPDNDFGLTPNFGPLHRFAYANDHFYVFHVQGADGKLFAYTITGQRDASKDLELHANNSLPGGIAYADGRFYVVDQQDSKVYAYTASGDRDAAADFDLGNDRFIWSLEGFVFANGRFYVLDGLVDKVYAYTTSGQRDATADFALACDNFSAIGIAYGNGGFHVLDWIDRKIYTYTGRNADLSLCFAIGSNPGNQSYPVGMGISPLTLPAARGGDGPLTYSLLPAVPGLSFNATMRRLTGTPTKIGTYDMTYRAMDVDGETGSLTFTITVTEPEPDLVVESVSVSDDTLNEGASFTLNATVRNAGHVNAAETTLRYYLSSDSIIAMSDTEVGTDDVGLLAASGTSAESIVLTAPSSAGTYYYGACVDSVSGETNTANNCSAAVAVTVSGDPPPPSDDYTPLERWWVYPNGLVNFVALTIGPGNCVNVNGSTLNGVTYVVHSSKWQRRANASSSWEDVAGTEQQGKVCSYIPTTSGEYRMVGDITVGTTRGNYSSDTITIN